MLYCGTSNIVLPVKNKTFFPPEFSEASRLTYYASLFNSLEVNQTFYKLPLERTLARWRDETPASFRFTLKLGKEITHNKGLLFDEAVLKRYMQVFDAIGEKKGCLLIQFPGGTKADAFNQLELLLELLGDMNTGWKLSVEFRDNSWYMGEVYELLALHHALLVEHDMPKSATPAKIPAADTRFFRFHGVEGDYRGTYTDELIGSYATKIKQAIAAKQDVYAYFNNTIGEAVHNALALQGRVAGTT
ncbi:DUF72 domain-containing protein [Sediminibacterium roseum]|uniref:DUF72 domain-containing protein n=1 Tax=Sediminibacterium roseum TaxID=1978412 RepID=A0ABW9ZWC4_9BACT|nr:DUF72 domain-containing protein [Sediminibacterium roseum]NCI49523.1 DUF72 domain-containing protein [Sediminibacterium roseum]